MLDKFMDYAIEHDLSVEDLMNLHSYDYAVVINDGKIVDFVYEGRD